MVSVALGWAPGVAPNGFGDVGMGAWVGAQWLRWRKARRQGWRPTASVVPVRAPRFAPNCFGGAGPGAKGGAQQLR